MTLEVLVGKKTQNMDLLPLRGKEKRMEREKREE